MSARVVGVLCMYSIGAGIQFFNILSFVSSNPKSIITKKQFPKSLIIPTAVGGLIVGSLLWPITLPLMVVHDLKNEKG